MTVPAVFLSAASDDLEGWRNVLHKAFERAGCKVFTQANSLGASAGSVLDLLRQHIDRSDFLVHLAGLAYGSEPERPAFDTHPDFKCSYTQFEYYYAHQTGKAVFAFVCAETFPYQAYTEKGKDEADRHRREQLQFAHRRRVAQGRFAGTPLEGHPDRPLSEPVADVNALVQVVAAAVGTIHLLSTEQLRSAFEFKSDITHFDVLKYAPAELLGRADELKVLDDAWAKSRAGTHRQPHVLTFVALGGEGKTSLVAHWAARLAHQDWPGCDAVFAWSFSSQGTGEQNDASSDAFLNAALAFFGGGEIAGGVTPFDKGRFLARLAGGRRALLILDGVEPLQYPPSSPTVGELRDQGLTALLKGLAAANHGLCVITTRYPVADLRAWSTTTAPTHELPRLPTAAGVELLRSLGVTRGLQAEFERLVEDVDGHALTLQIVGQFLARAFHGDLRRRDRIDLRKADSKLQGGRAFRAMDAYVQWLEDGSDESRRELAVLSLVGLFDRPAAADCVEALLRPPAIRGLTEPLVGVSEDDWGFSLTALRDAKLLTLNHAEGSGELLTIDAHPLVREYFARRLSGQQPEAWRTAHQRLFEYLCQNTKEGDHPTLEELQPLYQAVAHGCAAGLQQEACDKVYRDRILRGPEAYAVKKLGAIGADLGAVACFFETPWSRVSPALVEPAQAWLLNEAAFRLRAAGRLSEARDPARKGLEMRVGQQAWKSAAVIATLLSELELTLGNLTAAEGAAKQSVAHADRSRDLFEITSKRTTLADVLHHAGRMTEAEVLFRLAEGIQARYTPYRPLLYSWWGFRYCELLLDGAQRAAWRVFMGTGEATESTPLLESCYVVLWRAEQTLKIAEHDHLLLEIALDRLTQGRAALSAAILQGSSPSACHPLLQDAVAGLRGAGAQHELPRGLLTRAWLRYAEGARLGPDSAQSDLDEAWAIAEIGPMPLFIADIHLHRARLFFREPAYPWESSAADLAAARSLIERHGYFRRKEELEDAERVIGVPRA